MQPTEPAQEELVAQIVKQVNFYFSDANLPTDAFLLKEVQKNPEGWVPVRLIASFKRMKALSKDQAFIVAALQTSSELELSGHRVRRKAPLPMIDDTEVLLRTVIAENLPEQPTIDSLTAHFSSAGKVNMVRICQPNSGPRSVAQTVYGADLAVSRQLHALVEYNSQEEAAAAVKQLTDSNNWRSGLKVRPLLRSAFQPKAKQHKQQQPSNKAKQQQQQQQQQQHQQHQQQQPSDSSSKFDNQLSHTQVPARQLATPSQALDQATNAVRPDSNTATNEASADLALLSLQPLNSSVPNQSGGSKQQMELSVDASHQTAHEPPGQSQQTSKSRKVKKSKRDYAAWAGATVETRALATAHHDGNPDLDNPVAPSGRPRIPKQNVPAAPGSQPSGPDGSRGFAMGRGQAVAV